MKLIKFILVVLVFASSFFVSFDLSWLNVRVAEAKCDGIDFSATEAEGLKPGSAIKYKYNVTGCNFDPAEPTYIMLSADSYKGSTTCNVDDANRTQQIKIGTFSTKDDKNGNGKFDGIGNGNEYIKGVLLQKGKTSGSGTLTLPKDKPSCYLLTFRTFMVNSTQALYGSDDRQIVYSIDATGNVTRSQTDPGKLGYAGSTAVTQIDVAKYKNVPKDFDLRDLLKKLINILLASVGAFAVAMVVYGGYQYVTSFGDNKKMTNGKTTITWSVIGLITVLFAYALVRIMTNFFNLF